MVGWLNSTELRYWVGDLILGFAMLKAKFYEKKKKKKKKTIIEPTIMLLSRNSENEIRKEGNVWVDLLLLKLASRMIYLVLRINQSAAADHLYWTDDPFLLPTSRRREIKFQKLLSNVVECSWTMEN